MNDFEGRVAIVTGGASGIGLATARLLSSRGARVAALDLKPEGLPDGILGVQADVTDDLQVKSAVEAVVDRFGGLDVVVNNAGIGAIGDVTVNSDDEWLRVLDVNVVGMVRVARHAVPHLRRSTAASIVNTCSIVAWAGVQQRVLYSASKGAVYALTLAMAADHVREGIRVNCVAPGSADTPWIGRSLEQAPDPAAARAALEAFQPTGRLVTADEVASAITYLASPLSSASVGTVLAVDNGMHGLRLRPGPGLSS
ncbi:SDR family NAD(P)-dependent oxidoreductase [Micromonospora halophytica]|uniref:NAD(P)-dependent dehydrogenase, short-chain alcohol dehydrogenase family n=1 Tax=Micromonospora halophytica TaxID=47864 RepID=A0A1C5JFR1_9ACTN|nr:SDR family oxidoreductase [Micromonospora halophytica]SCG69407.1 NAD(P)-dependent dehydrogenase, short-chain alcohol dehydrogenase family [Micromonospora halophytica]